jgi:uncharacterized surface protein with fasciclin (FAS1) repeats
LRWLSVESGESVIYLISGLLEPPLDVIQTAVSDLGLSTFIASTFAASLNKFVQRAPAITYFIPTNKAFAKMGLTMSYLLTSDAKDDLRKLIKYHAVQGVHYMNDIEEEEQAYKTVQGRNLMIWRNATSRNATNPQICVHAPPVNISIEGAEDGLHRLVPSNGETNPAQVLYGDILTNTGVIHVIDSVKLPPNVDITLGKLVKGSAKGGTMMDLLKKAGMGWLLQGRQPEIEELAMIGLARRETTNKGKNTTKPIGDCGDDVTTGLASGYVLLVPTDAAFSRLNMSFYLTNEAALIALLKLHVIPSERLTTAGAEVRTEGRQAPNPKKGRSQLVDLPSPKEGHPLTLDNDIVYPTLLSQQSKYGDLAIRGNGDNGWLVGVRDARGAMGQTDVARILASGRGSPRWTCGGNASAVASHSAYGDTIEDDVRNDSDQVAISDLFWDGTMSLGGGVVMLDNVLLPYEPSWFMKWGWLVLTLSFVGLLCAGLSLLAWWWWRARRLALQEDGMGSYEPLEGEEDD